MLEKIYLVVQNIDYLKGTYFVSAVVIARSGEEAIEKVREELDYMSTAYEDEILFDVGRISVFELGNLERRPRNVGINQRLENEDVLVVLVGEDYDY